MVLAPVSGWLQRGIGGIVSTASGRMAARLQSIMLLVRDAPRSARFFQDALGLHVRMASGGSQCARVLFLCQMYPMCILLRVLCVCARLAPTAPPPPFPCHSS